MIDSKTILALSSSVHRYNSGFRYMKSWDYHKSVLLFDTNMNLLVKAIKTYNTDTPLLTIEQDDIEWAEKVYEWFKKYSMLSLRDSSTFATQMYQTLFSEVIKPERYPMISYLPHWWIEKERGIVVLPSYVRNIVDKE